MRIVRGTKGRRYLVAPSGEVVERFTWQEARLYMREQVELGVIEHCSACWEPERYDDHTCGLN